MAEPREKRADLILQQLEELPTLPIVAVRVLQVTGDDASSARQVVDLIHADPALSARILQLVHRADAGIRGEVKTVQRAVSLLGFDAIRSAVLALSVFQSMGRKTPGSTGHFDYDEFWKHCLAVGCCAELMAEEARVPTVTPGEAFVCGLLHDLGKIALSAALPKSFSRVVEAADLLRGNIADVERSVIGLDHMVVGKRLAERWMLPSIIRDCVWLHGQDPRALPSNIKNPRMVNLITLADELVRQQHLGYSGNYLFSLPRQALLDGSGVSPAIVKSALAKLVARIQPRAESLGLGKATTTELFQQALAQANKELGHVSGQLAAKNRKLTVRAQFFEALSKFQGELRPDAAAQTVLQAIAQTAVSVLGVPCVAAFSLPPGQTYAESLLCDSDGRFFETALIDLPRLHGVDGLADKAAEPSTESDAPAPWRAPAAESSTLGEAPAAPAHIRPAPPRTGDGPVLPAGPDLEWFISVTSPRLSHEQRFWICLAADRHCVGGIVWGAEAGEAQRLSSQAQELATIANGWALALRTSQIREEARALAEQLAEANRQLQTAQSEVLRSRTLVTVSEMAAGAAHEMNTPLAVISGRSQLLAQQLTDIKLKAAATLVHEQAHRLSAIITELMDFARPKSPAAKPVDIADVIDSALCEAKTANDPADRKIEVTLGQVPWVMVDPTQVSAAIREVIENAFQATDRQTGQIHLHAGFDPYSSRVVVTVTDNGCGMDENTAKRAFDPFFSAKPAGRRRGLGLPKALRWIEASGGSIRLESRPGLGTRTVILLPAVASGGSPGIASRVESKAS